MNSPDKLLVMKSMYKLLGAVAIVLFVAACGATTDGNKKELEKKKAKLEDLKKDQAKANDEIATLEKEIAKLDTSAARAEKPKLVTLTTLQPDTFTHYIDLQGKIDAEKTAWVTPRGAGGQVRALYVKQGDYI